MEDNNPKPSEGPGDKLVTKNYVILFVVLQLAATGALLYGLYAACPTCEPAESAAGAAPTTTTNIPRPSQSQPPGVTPSTTAQGSQTNQTQRNTSQPPGDTAPPTPAVELKLIAVAPNSGSVMGGNLVRLEGVGLNNVKEVRFGGQPATPVGLPSLTSLTVKPPAHVEGRVDVVVIDGQSRDNSANPAFYTYTCPPPSGRSVIWLMVLVGALGAILHGLRSFSWYVGNRQLVWSWIPMYFILPFIGAATSTVFYLIIRGGLMSGATESNNVFGLMALGTLVGLFSQQALEKLKKISEGIFTSTPTGKDSRPEKPPLKVDKVSPQEGQGNQLVTILGSGFVKEKVMVRFDDIPAEVLKAENQAITVNTPERPPGKVKVLVIQDGQSFEAPGGFTYKNPETAPAGPPPQNKPEGNAGPPPENIQDGGAGPPLENKSESKVDKE